jgi:hypothetical protein
MKECKIQGILFCAESQDWDYNTTPSFHHEGKSGLINLLFAATFFLIEVPLPNYASEAVMSMCVRGVSSASVSTMFLLDIGVVLTVCFFHISCQHRRPG